VAKAEWGQKRICQHCSARFYDMRRDPIACPKCGTVFDPSVSARPRRSREEPARAAPVAPKPAPVAEEVAVAELEVEEDAEEAAEAEEEEEATIEDASELGEDEDDVAEVLDNVDDEEEGR
jgi:uncharacterized protein (TIGR02300 family)